MYNLTDLHFISAVIIPVRQDRCNNVMTEYLSLGLTDKSPTDRRTPLPRQWQIAWCPLLKRLIASASSLVVPVQRTVGLNYCSWILGMFGGPEVSYHHTYSARDWLSILRTPYQTQNFQRKHRTDSLEWKLFLKIYNTQVLPTFLNGSENCTLTALQRWRNEAAEMKLLRPLAGYTLYDHKTKDYIRRELRITRTIDKIDEYRRSWLSHLQRMPLKS